MFAIPIRRQLILETTGSYLDLDFNQISSYVAPNSGILPSMFGGVNTMELESDIYRVFISPDFITSIDYSSQFNVDYSNDNKLI